MKITADKARPREAPVAYVTKNGSLVVANRGYRKGVVDAVLISSGGVCETGWSPETNSETKLYEGDSVTITF